MHGGTGWPSDWFEEGIEVERQVSWQKWNYQYQGGGACGSSSSHFSGPGSKFLSKRHIDELYCIAIRSSNNLTPRGAWMF